VSRRSLKPGQMYTMPWMPHDRVALYPRDEVWIVLDAASEIGFWSGAKTVLGEFAPSTIVRRL
jgi:hypothetical protein